MAKVLTFKIPENEVEQLKAILQQFHEEVEKSRATMKSDQAEIERIRKESREIKINTDKMAAETKVLLDDLSRRILKAA